MEFITVEQFQEQPKEIQQVFLDWWQPSIGDIYCNEFLINFKGDKIQKLEVVRNTTEINYIKDVSEFLCVLLTEGQLKKFIEDKAECILDITVEDLIGNCRVYTVIGWRVKESENGAEFEEILIEEYAIENDLIQLYWKIACRVAKEG